jgi:hypothetical protein
MTFIEAAPARPTLIVTGLTRAERAKFCIFFGIVAENNRVCLCPCATIKSCNLGKRGVRHSGRVFVRKIDFFYCAQNLINGFKDVITIKSLEMFTTSKVKCYKFISSNLLFLWSQCHKSEQ